MTARKRMASILGPIIQRYIDLKRSLGRGYDNERWILSGLDRFLCCTARTTSDLTPESFAKWCRALEHLAPGVRRNRMRVARNLCLYRRRTEPKCFVPDLALFPAPHQSVRPYIFSETEVARLITMTGMLKRTRQRPIPPETFRLAIILLYTTGLRRNELVRLTVGDFNKQELALLIRGTKFHKSRFIPLSEDGTREVQSYLELRHRLKLPLSPDAPLLWNGERGFRGYTGQGFGHKLHQILEVSGIRKHNGRPPRVHDFRWTFAVHALLRWYRSGADLQAKLPLLATYMGHVSITSTEYYLPLVEPLSMAAGSLFAKHCGNLITPLTAREGSEQ